MERVTDRQERAGHRVARLLSAGVHATIVKCNGGHCTDADLTPRDEFQVPFEDALQGRRERLVDGRREARRKALTAAAAAAADSPSLHGSRTGRTRESMPSWK